MSSSARYLDTFFVRSCDAGGAFARAHQKNLLASMTEVYLDSAIVVTLHCRLLTWAQIVLTSSRLQHYKLQSKLRAYDIIQQFCWRVRWVSTCQSKFHIVANSLSEESGHDGIHILLASILAQVLMQFLHVETTLSPETRDTPKRIINCASIERRQAWIWELRYHVETNGDTNPMKLTGQCILRFTEHMF